MASPLMATPTVERILGKLKHVKAAGSDRWMALCPSHDDKQRSLSVRTGKDGRVLMHCHAGCTFPVIVAALGLTMSDTFVDGKPPLSVAPTSAPHVEKSQGVSSRSRLVKSYDYTDADGTLLYQVCRMDPKAFPQRHRDANGDWKWGLGGVTPVLYRLPEIIEATASERRVFIVEGEKDADTLAELGYAATTSPMGAGKWRDAYADVLAGADVVIIPDNDEAGRAHAQTVAESLYAHDASVRLVTLPDLGEKEDVSDWLAKGRDVDELEVLVSLAPRWLPDQDKRTRWWVDEVWENAQLMQPPAPVVPYLAWASRSTLLAAREKSGKSTLTGYISAQVSRGGDFLGEPCHHGKVLIIGLEEFIGDTARRLKQFGANGRAIAIVDRFAGEATARVHEIAAHIEAVKPLLVIVDSLVAYSSGMITSATDSNQMQPVVQGLTDLCHRTAVALIIIHHARKADGKYRDSSAIGGAVDIIAEVFPPEECATTDPNRRRVRPIGRVPARSVDFRFDGRDYTLVDAADPQKGPLDQRILHIVKDRPHCSANDVCEAIGEQRQQVLTRITHLIATGVLMNDGDTRRAKLRVPAFTPASALL